MILPAADPKRLESEWEADQDVLANLLDNGDRPELPRSVDVSFRGTPDVLAKLTEAAADYGFEFIEIEEAEEGDPWLFLEREQPADAESIKSLTALCLQLEAAFGVEYDGWGCVAQSGLPE
ncbi:MAG: hypothetical protein JWM75_234 [Sphingomonas bacterium]|nr:hypothetical protein [Sphingomonas bacterium]